MNQQKSRNLPRMIRKTLKHTPWFKKDLSHESAEIQKSAKNDKKNIETYAKGFSQQILAASACPEFPLPGSSLLSYPTAYMYHDLVNLSESASDCPGHLASCSYCPFVNKVLRHWLGGQTVASWFWSWKTKSLLLINIDLVNVNDWFFLSVLYGIEP